MLPALRSGRLLHASLCVAVLLAASSPAASAQEPDHRVHPVANGRSFVLEPVGYPAAEAASVPAAFAVATASPRAAELVALGVEQLHAGDIPAATHLFRGALAADPACPMAAWGLSFALAQDDLIAARAILADARRRLLARTATGPEWEERWMALLASAFPADDTARRPDASFHRRLMEGFAQEATLADAPAGHAQLFHAAALVRLVPHSATLAVESLAREASALNPALPASALRARAGLPLSPDEIGPRLAHSPALATARAELALHQGETAAALQASADAIRLAAEARARAGLPLDGDPAFARTVLRHLDLVSQLGEPADFETALASLEFLPRRPVATDEGVAFSAEAPGVSGYEALHDVPLRARFRHWLRRGEIASLSAALAGPATLADPVRQRFWNTLLALLEGHPEAADTWKSDVAERLSRRGWAQVSDAEVRAEQTLSAYRAALAGHPPWETPADTRAWYDLDDWHFAAALLRAGQGATARRWLSPRIEYEEWRLSALGRAESYPGRLWRQLGRSDENQPRPATYAEALRLVLAAPDDLGIRRPAIATVRTSTEAPRRPVRPAYAPPLMPRWQVRDSTGRSRNSEEFSARPYLAVFYLGKGCIHCVEQLQEFKAHRERFRSLGLDLLAFGIDPWDQLGLTQEKVGAGPDDFPFLVLSDSQQAAFRATGAYDTVQNRPLHGVFLVDANRSVLWSDVSAQPFGNIAFLADECERLLRLWSGRAPAGDAPLISSRATRP